MESYKGVIDLKILTAGHELLKKQADPVLEFNVELHELAELLTTVMHDRDGAGLSAPQIGVSKQVFVYYIKNNPRYPHAPDIPLTVVINPRITRYSTELDYSDEGCLSLPNVRGMVPRSFEIDCVYYNLEGKQIERTITGFEAKVMQHETDHLMGILFPQRMTDLSTLWISKY
jgi:peptide deformylase